MPELELLFLQMLVILVAARLAASAFRILNVGLDLHILSPTLFSMMVIMAFATTLMTTPLIDWLYPSK